MNKPYVKQYSAKTGALLNPLKGNYVSMEPNRRGRRLYLQKVRPTGYVLQLHPQPFASELTPKGRIKKSGLCSPLYKNRRKFKNIHHSLI